MSDKSWEPELSLSHSLTHSLTLTLSLSHSLTLDMLNNFCFHVYAQKALFIGENGTLIITLSCEFRGHRAGSQLKMPSQVRKLRYY